MPPSVRRVDADDSTGGFLTLMRQRFQTAAGAWSECRQQAIKDIQFCDLNMQWELQDEANRNAAKRPCLTVNQVRQFKLQIVNQQRAARPGPKVTPKGARTDQDTAEILEGILEHIEHPDDRAPAETWIDMAFDNMVTCGQGWLRWYTRYKPKTRVQEILIAGVNNPMSVYPDPAFTEPDASDMRYCFVVEDLPKDEFERKYRMDAAAVSAMTSEIMGLGDQMPNWLPEGQIRTAEYFYLDTQDVEMAEVEDESSITGTRVLTAEAAKAQKLTIINTHLEPVSVTMRALVTGNTVLEGNAAKSAGAEIVSDGIPVIPVFGDMTLLNGKRNLAGMVRYMRDPAKMINFLVSALAENIALMPKPKWLAETTVIEDFKDIWADANNANYSTMPWTAKAGPDGTPLPAPEMITNEPPIAAIVEGLSVFTNMIQATASLHDPSLGKQKSDQSGTAVALLQQQGQVGTSNWQDNLARSLKCLYRQIVRAIPKVYDVPQVFQIVRGDDQPQNVLIHGGKPPAGLTAGHDPIAPTPAQQQQFPGLQDVEKIYDLSDLEFAVDVTTGPNFQSARQENQAWLLELAKIMPPQQQAVIMPLLVENSDAPVARQVAQILKKMIGPEMYPDPNGPAPLPPEAQKAIQDLTQHLQMTTQELHAKTQYIETEQGKIHGQIEVEKTKQSFALEMKKVENAAKIAAAWITATKGGTVDAERRDESLATGLSMAHEAHQSQLDRAHEVGMALLGHGHAMATAAAGASAEADQSTQDAGEASAQAEQGQQHALEQGQQAADLAPEPQTGDNAPT